MNPELAICFPITVGEHRTARVSDRQDHILNLVGELFAETDLVGVSLHRLRHFAAATFVGRGEPLRTQIRLGHRDPSTTLRNDVDALPLEDGDVAGDSDVVLIQASNPERGSEGSTIAPAFRAMLDLAS